MSKCEKILIRCVWELLICVLTITANQDGKLIPDRTSTIMKLTDVTNDMCELYREAIRNGKD